MLKAADFEQACVCQALRRVARQVARRYEEAMRGTGLTTGQFAILAALLREDAVSLGVLAKVLGMDRTTLTRELRPLERRGLLTSAPAPDDRRVRTLRLSEQGLAVMREAIPRWEQAQEATHRRLPPSDWRRLRAELERLV